MNRLGLVLVWCIAVVAAAVIPLIMFPDPSAFAQSRPETGAVVYQSTGPPPPWTFYNSYDASSNLEYICRTKPNQALWQWDIAAALDATLTNIVVSANVGTVTTAAEHGLRVNQAVVVSGATVDTDLNGSYIVTMVTNTTVFTITTVDVANATYTDAGLVMGTRAPRLTAAIWHITKLSWSAGLLVDQQVLVGLPGVDTTGVGNVGNANRLMKLACSARATFSGR